MMADCHKMAMDSSLLHSHDVGIGYSAGYITRCYHTKLLTEQRCDPPLVVVPDDLDGYQQRKHSIVFEVVYHISKA